MTPTAPAPRPLSLAAYRFAAGLASPFARSLLQARARQGKEDGDRLEERLGRASAPRPAGPLVWLHAISVGESVSLLPLIGALAAERTDLRILVTSGTRASARVLAQRLPPGAIHQYAPVDTPGAVERFLTHWRPDVGLFAESELWPNLILAARAQGVRLALVSARMTARSARAWRARPAAVGAMLRAFELILPQDEATSERLASFGGAIAGRLNLKRLAAPLAHDPAELARLKGMIGDRPTLVAISTHAPEEALIVRATATLSPRRLLVIAPRHPERASDIGRELHGLSVARRSAAEPITATTDVYLADTLGEIGLLLRLAPFVVMGGGFPEDVGGHNPLEPAQIGVGVVTGPHFANHADIYAEMIAAGAARVAADEAALAATLARLLADPAEARAMASAAAAYANAQRGQLGAALDQIRPLLPDPGAAA